KNGRLTGEQFGESAVFVDGEVVNDWLHGERYPTGKALTDFAHERAEGVLSFRFTGWIEDETHAAAGHAAEHPESPEGVAERGTDFVDEFFGVEIAGPWNDALKWAVEVALRSAADGRDVAGTEVCDDFVEKLTGLLACDPFLV